MKISSYIYNFIYRIRYWVILFPIIITLLTYCLAKNIPNTYTASAEIYTGVFSEANFQDAEHVDINWNIKNNTMENLLKIITSYNTLTNVSLRLLAQHLAYGDQSEDNLYINSENYKNLLKIVPPNVIVLVDKSSDEKTYQNIIAYQKKHDNVFFKNLLNGDNPYYSYKALFDNVSVKREGKSDIIEVEYMSSDPQITYYTIDLLNKELVKQYKEFYTSQTNNTVLFWESELNKYTDELKQAEDSLFEYNLDQQIINYDEQTKNAVAMDWKLQTDYQMRLLQYKGSEAIIAKLEIQMKGQADKFKNSADFIKKLDEISDLSLKMYKCKLSDNESDIWKAKQFNNQLTNAEIELKNLSAKIYLENNTSDGIPISSLLDEWFEQNTELIKAKSEMYVIDEKRYELRLNSDNLLYAGLILKGKERNVDTKEKNYISLLDNLNSAQLKQKGLLLTGDNFKILTPPVKSTNVLNDKAMIHKMLFVFVGSIIFIIGFFLLLEMLSIRLQNKIKTEHLTSHKVLGVLPAIGNEASKKQLLAIKYLENSILRFIRIGQVNVINLISIDDNEGKTFVGNILINKLESLDFSVEYFSWNTNMDYKSKKYLLAQNIDELCEHSTDDIIIIEHPPLNQNIIHDSLLKDAQINILVVDAAKKWKDRDQLIIDEISNKGGETPFFIYLNKSYDNDATLF